jgi:hypothetical protein
MLVLGRSRGQSMNTLAVEALQEFLLRNGEWEPVEDWLLRTGERYRAAMDHLQRPGEPHPWLSD